MYSNEQECGGSQATTIKSVILKYAFFTSQIQKMLQAFLLNREVWKFTNEDSLLNRICPKIVLLKLNFSCESSVHFKKLQLS